ncbi:MAG: hypothetical protein MH252_21740 [Thermosynechococcaceae cyanobacterium MS004]|nr:hypothetical protein [Thermosynechococcaceae cyanobacterium MS004]
MTQLKHNSPNITAFQADGRYWNELKHAISDTSGFKRWILERDPDIKDARATQDAMVQLYLRQTLETLAY